MARKKRKTAKRGGKKKKKKKAAGRRRGRPAGLKGATTAALQQELDRRRDELAQRRDALLHELDEIEREIETFGGASPGPGRPRKKTRRGPGRPRKTKKKKTAGKRGRPRKKSARRKTGGRKRAKNKQNLVEALSDVLKNKTMSVTEAADAVQKAGYKTTSPNFRTIVNQALLKHDGAFKKVSRGQYTAK